MRHIAVVLVVAGFGLAGCTGVSTDGSNPLANCDGNGACKVAVSVTACAITPSPDSLPVTGHNVDIFWELDIFSAILYRFRDGDGVTLKQQDSDFGPPAPQANNKKYKMHDQNSKAMPGQTLSYPYTINIQQWSLVQFGWVDCPLKDPTIVNQG
jgi:hypothetical protein